MATPTMITITGTVIATPPSTPDATAKVTLEQEVWLTHSDGTVVEPQKYVGVANGSGVVSVQVPACTNPAWLPQGWTYRVTFDGVENPEWAKPFRCVVPYDAPGATVTLGSLVPVGSASDGVIYAPANHSHSAYATTAALADVVNDVSSLETQVALLPDTADVTAMIEALDRVVTGGELILRRKDANSRFKLLTGNLYLTHFTATQTRTILSIRTTAKVGATGTDNAYIGILNWTPGVNYTPNAVSVDDPSRWANPVSYDTLLFKATPGTGVANLADPGFSMVAGQKYAAFVLWNGDGGAQGPELVACLVNDEDAMIEPRENAYIVLAAPPSSALMPEWVAPSPAQIQGFLKQ